MPMLFKHFQNTFKGSAPPTLSRLVDGGNNDTNLMMLKVLSINSLALGTGLEKGHSILQKQNQVGVEKEVNGYNTYSQNYFQN